MSFLAKENQQIITLTNAIMRKKILLLLTALFLYNAVLHAQGITVTGSATDESGARLIGVTVAVKGTNQGTSTDLNGNYSIDVSDPEGATLVYSYIGYRTIEILVSGQTVINVMMVEDISLLDEVIVVGYGVQAKRLVTGSISRVESDDLIVTQPSRVESAIQGKVAGVTIAAESGSPGAGLTVQIRGASSNRNTNPLFVVDGMKTGGIDFLDPNDIESIEILKDAASTAIFGAEGGNGVVLITTKSGQKGRVEVNYSYFYGSQNYIPRVRVLNTQQYVDYYQSAITLENTAPDGTVNSRAIARALTQLGLPQIGDPLPTHNTDWLNEITNVAPMQSHSLNISGGNERTLYNSSISYYTQDGITGGNKSNFNRMTARLRVDHSVNSWLGAGANVIYSNRRRSALGENSEFGGLYTNALLLDPLTPTVYATDDDINPDYAGSGFDEIFVRNSKGQAFGMSSFVKNEIRNPLAVIETAQGGWEEDKIMAGAFLEFKPIKGLTFRSSYDIDVAHQDNKNWGPASFFHNLNVNEVSTSFMQVNEWSSWQFDNVLSYSTMINKHSISLIAGTHAHSYNHHAISGWGQDLIREDDAFSHPALGQNLDTLITPNDVLGGYFADPIRLASEFGRFSYNYDERYLLNVTVRRDRSSRLSPKDDNQSGIFPSASLGWVVSNESFWQFPLINFFKARYSYGVNGSLGAVGSFEYVPLIQFTGNPYTDAAGNIIQGATPQMLSNDALRWESTSMHNLGVDINLLDNRVTFVADYFLKKTEDLLTLAPIPNYVGNAAPNANAGSVENRGWEFELSYRQREGKFQWDLSGNISFIQNKVIFIGNTSGILTGANLGTTGAITRSEEGLPLWYFYGYQVDGLWESWEDIDQNNTLVDTAGNINEIQRNVRPGDIKIVDTDGNGRITIDDKTMIGSPHPDIIAGLNFNAFYAGFDLGMTFTSSIGNDVYYGVYRDDLPQTNRPDFFLTEAWSADNPDAEFFRPTAKSQWNFQHSSIFVQDGSYLKLRNIQLGYTLPSSLTKMISISRTRAYMSVNNVFTLTSYKGSDPEMGYTAGLASFGVDRGFYPQARQFIFGVNFTF